MSAQLRAIAMLQLLLALLPLMLSNAAPPPPRSALSRYDFDAARPRQLALPPALRELSGLAVLPDGSWLAHDDERGIIYRRAVGVAEWRTFVQFDGAEARGDFEAIAAIDGWVWLQQSDGRRRGHRLVQTPPVPDQRVRERAPCEVEGLIAANDGWWAPCKRTGRQGGLLFVRQSRSGGRWQEGWRISGKALLAFGLPRVLGISDALVDRETGHWLLVAGPEHRLVEVTAAGELVAAVKLSPKQHPQAESLAQEADGTLLIGDEGDEVGTITSYPPRVR